jgi:hypothetical protein
MPQKKDNDEETVSDQEIWLAIRYLDPDTKSEVNDIVAIVTLNRDLLDLPSLYSQKTLHKEN